MLPRPDDGRPAGNEARKDGSHRDSDSKWPTLAFVADQYLADLATRARPRGVGESRAILERVVRELGAVNVEELSRPAVLTWRQMRIAGGASNKTVNNALAVLLAALALCVQLEQLAVSPLHGIRSLPTSARHQRRRPRALSEWEIARLLGAAEELDREGAAFYSANSRGVRIPQVLLVRTLIETGARWGELTLATWGDLDGPGASLTFRAENTKTDSERTVPLRVELIESLLAYRLNLAAALGAMPSAAAPIFLSPAGKPCTRDTSNFLRFLRAAYERAGMLERGPDGKLRPPDGRALNVHTLRHTACTRLLGAGAPVPVVQAILGHASPTMTLRVYAHVQAEAGRVAVEGLGNSPAVPDGSRKARPDFEAKSR